MNRAQLLTDLAAWIAARRGSHPLRIAVDGIDASGKTTLADELGPYLQANSIPILRASIDGFHQPRAHRYRQGKLSAAGYYHDSFDLEAFASKLLQPLSPGGTRRVQTAVFDYRSDTPINLPLVPVPPDGVLLCDGIFLLRPELRPYWHLSIFLDVHWETAVRRAVRRDYGYLGGESAGRHRYQKRYIPAQQIYFRCRPRQAADVLIDNNDPANPAILSWRGRPQAAPLGADGSGRC